MTSLATSPRQISRRQVGAQILRQLERAVLFLSAAESPKLAVATPALLSEPLAVSIDRLRRRVERTERRFSGNWGKLSVLVLSLAARSDQGDDLPVSDWLLRRAVQLLRARLRRSDIVGRFGREQLVVGLIGSGEFNAYRLAESLSRQILDGLNSSRQTLTIRYGVASLKRGMTVADLIGQAQTRFPRPDQSTDFQDTGQTLIYSRRYADFQSGYTASYSQLFTWTANLRYQLARLGIISNLERVSLVLMAAFQILVVFGYWLVLELFTDFEILGRDNLKEVKKPLIVTSNHESHLDPLLLGVAFLTQPRLYPLQFLAKNEMFNYPVYNVLIYLLGAFKAHRKKGLDRSLLIPMRIMKRKGTVVFFPEGKIISQRPKLGQGRRGAAVLALLSGATILPVSLSSPANLTPWRFLTTRPHLTVRIGRPYQLDPAEYLDFSDENMTRPTGVIMDRIAALYQQYRY